MFESNPVFALLSRALDAAALRQAVHTTNIANADVADFRRLEVSFDAELQAARAVATDEAVRLDKEMALMAKDAVQYQALLGAFERSIGLLRLAARDGREG